MDFDRMIPAGFKKVDELPCVKKETHGAGPTAC
jgi:hypothetical protein